MASKATKKGKSGAPSANAKADATAPAADATAVSAEAPAADAAAGDGAAAAATAAAATPAAAAAAAPAIVGPVLGENDWYLYLPHFEHTAAANTLKCTLEGGTWLKKTTEYSGGLEEEQKRMVDLNEVFKLIGPMRPAELGGPYDIMHRLVTAEPFLSSRLSVAAKLEARKLGGEE